MRVGRKHLHYRGQARCLVPIVWRLLRWPGGAGRVCGLTRVDDARIALYERLTGALRHAVEAVEVAPGEDGSTECLSGLGGCGLVEVAGWS